MHACRLFSTTLIGLVCASSLLAAPPAGYYRQPALARDGLIFVSEGDLWKVPLTGGVATRLTSHPSEESLPAISPDGLTLAFVAAYEGPSEVYTMPPAGGPPERRTYDGGHVTFVGWSPDGQILYATRNYSKLPDEQLFLLDVRKPATAQRTPVPLSQAADGSYDPSGTLYFTRLPFQGSQTKRYRGGTVQNLWKFGRGDNEARPLTADFPGTSKRPMWWQGRVYFASDRDGTMNLWSMRDDGSDLRQHTRHAGWDVAGPSLGQGKIAYQLGADIRVYDIAADTDRAVPIILTSDFDQTREHWVKQPMEYVTAVHLAPDGSRVVLTARGRIFVAPRRQGRLVEVTPREGVRYRDARFFPDGKSLLALSDQSGEVELWRLPANGVGEAEQLTRDADVLRWEGVPSPDGKLIAHRDKNLRLFVYDAQQKQNRKIDEWPLDDRGDSGLATGLRWSPDSKWLAYVAPAPNLFQVIKLYSTADGKLTNLTTDRCDSSSPAWSPDGRWLYFLSDRHLKTIVPSPWGNHQPEPFLDKKTKIYHVPLIEGLRSPFAPADELHADKDKDEKKDEKKPGPPVVRIDLAGIERRLIEVPVPPGNYGNLSVNEKGVFWLSLPTGERQYSGRGELAGSQDLLAAAFARENVEVKTVVKKIKRYELAQDGKNILVHKDDKLYVLDAAVAPAELDKRDVDLSHWNPSVRPRDEWRQMLVEAWRLERDYFYDRGMHGVDWKSMLRKYQRLVDRVHSRDELSDLIAQMVSELSALHIFVVGGDLREGPDHVEVASLGADLVRDEPAGGYRVRHIHQADPDYPEEQCPLIRPGVGVKEGDVVELIDGRRTLDAADIGLLLRNKGGRQVLLRVRSGTASRDVITRPLDQSQAADLRYHDWESRRRQFVEQWGKGEIGYVHLRAMGGDNYTEWVRNYYPVFTRQGLIIDMRHNRGGNIDSWILGRLLRKAWFFWSQRAGRAPLWDMQYAFRGHLVVLCDEHTASDGEAFTEGFRRLGLGKVVGTRTWGGEIWLSFSNFLVDRGIASAAEMGVYGPEGVWLIEGHGVDPDIVVDNLPHATFQGEDVQLKAAVAYLQKQIQEKPVPSPKPPVYPNKALRLSP
jgi:tricorn protease